MIDEYLAKYGAKKLLAVLVSGSIVFGLLLGSVGTVIFHDRDEDFKEVRSKGSYTFINPLLECENVDLEYSNTITKLQDVITPLIDQLEKEGKAEFISYYFRDLNNGPWFAVNETEAFSPASLIKLPIAFAIYKQAEVDPTFLQRKILNTTEDLGVDQNIMPDKLLTAQTEYTVEELLEYMLVYSNNRAFELLDQLLREEYPAQLNSIFLDLGVTLDPSFMVNPSGNIISVREYSSFFRILYNSSYLSKPHSEKILSYLSKATYSEGIAAGVPPGTGVAHKYGERYFLADDQRQFHDCGIVYTKQTPYLICVMTRGDDFEELTEVVEEISKATYENFIE